MKRYFITGIGTDVGKSIVSAILAEALNADYWKPLQAGDLDNTDTMKVKALVSNSVSKFHPEIYRFSKAMSPHAAADIDETQIDTHLLTLPETANTLIIEGAGGLMVPLTQQFLVIDLIEKLQTEAIIVSRNYLGSINHTLLTVAALKDRNISIAGIIFNGTPNIITEEFILNYTGLKCLLRMQEETDIDKKMVQRYAALLSI